MSQTDSLNKPTPAGPVRGAPTGEPNTALKKAVTALEMFAVETRPLSPTEIGNRLDLSRQAVHRLLRQLEDLGLVLRLPEDKFILGPRTNKLAIDVINASHVSAAIHPILQNVVTLVGETCNIGMLDGYELVYIDRVECNWPLRVPLRPGSRVPSHCTGIGKLLLAHLPARRRKRVLSTMPLRRYTEHTITDRTKLEKHLSQIRKQGFSINNQEDSIGLIAFAVPVRNSSGAVFAGLAIHGPEVRMPIEKAKSYLGQLNDAAEQLGDVLEFSSSDT